MMREEIIGALLPPPGFRGLEGEALVLEVHWRVYVD